eukprot:15347785-Ditylum_brightwellii.AAC.1
MIPCGSRTKNNESEDKGDGKEEVVVAHEKDKSKNNETTLTMVVNELDSTVTAATVKKIQRKKEKTKLVIS